jgi:dihydroorotate dehydrogenase (NAD+) catalytic subunit
VPKYDLSFATPHLNAAGFLGFAPDRWRPNDIFRLGAFITNPVSLRARSPAHGKRCLPFPGGFLLHTGHPNPGLSQVIRRHASSWERSALPILVHLLAENPTEVSEMVKRLERVTGVMGIEVGIPPGCDRQTALALAQAAVGELPVIVHLPFETAAEFAPSFASLPIAAISLGAPHGVLPDPQGNLVYGRLYGPATFPPAMKVIQSMIISKLPVIAAGGIYSPQNAETMLAASGVRDAVLWLGRW